MSEPATEPVQAQQAAMDPPRMAKLPDTLDLGEQLVGSDEWFRVGVPTVLDGSSVGIAVTHVAAIASEPGGDAFATSMLPHQIAPGASSPFQVNFAPRRAGLHSAMMTIDTAWSDGITSSHQVELHGRARNQTDVPMAVQLQLDESEQRQQPAQAADATHDAPKGSLATSTYVNADKAITAAAALAGHQRVGLHIAEREANSYQRQPPEEPWWVTLAEIALSMGVAGVAASAARAVAPLIGAQLVKLVAMSAETRKVVEYGVQNAVKQGLRAAGNGAVGLLPLGPKTAKPKSPNAGEDPALSTNAKIAFFGEQENALVALEKQNRLLHQALIVLLAAHEVEHPGVTDACLIAVADAFDATGEAATLEQAKATEMQWVAGIARSSTSTAVLPSGRVVTTGNNAQWHDDGILEVDVTTTVPLDNHAEVEPNAVRATRASIKGISQEIADRMCAIGLDGERVPIVFRVAGPNYTLYVRRDEVGRITMSDINSGPFNPEPTISERTARAIADRVLERPLKSWGLAIKSDDASGRGDPIIK